MRNLRRTTIQLTIKYSLVFFVFVWLLSAGIYLWVNNSLGEGYVDRINRTLEQQHSTPSHQTEISDSAATVAADISLDQLRNILLVVNAVMLLGIPFVAYAISKRTLMSLVESQRIQQRFIANASHELRTPLALMLTELDWADKKDRSVEEYKTTITGTKYEVQHMSTLVKSLLTLARLFDGAAITKETITVSSLIEEVSKMYEKEAKERGLHISLDLQVQKISGDKNLVRIVISNLIDNAIKYAKPDTEIAITTNQSGIGTIFQVSNVANNLTLKQLDHLFDQFYQGDIHQADEGYGLGLAIVRQIMDAHGGVVEATLQEDNQLNITLSF